MHIKHGYFGAVCWDYCRSEGFAFTGYDIPGCVEDGAWMLWEKSSVVAVVVAHPCLGRGQLSVLLLLQRFRDARIDPSRLPSADGIRNTESCRRTKSNIKKPSNKQMNRDWKQHSIQIPYKNPLYKSLAPIPFKGLLCSHDFDTWDTNSLTWGLHYLEYFCDHGVVVINNIDSYRRQKLK